MKTYPEMNEEIKKLLKFSGQNYELYALQRIIELEKQVIGQQKEIEQLEKIKKLSNAEELTLADFAKEVLRIIEGREISIRKQRN